MNIQDFAENLHLKDGIYFSTKTREISYPKEGNQNCFQIEQDSFWFNHRNNCIKAAVLKHSPHKTFFDIGGGNGFVAKGLENSNIETVLVEPGIQGALNAQKRGLKTVVCATLEDAGFKPNSLPAAGLFDVVEHIENDEKFLTSIHAYLKKDGLVFITVPAYKFLWSKEDQDAGHYRRYTLRKLRRLLKKAGFEIKFSTYIFSILPLPIFLFRTIPNLLKLNKNSKDLNKHKKEHTKNKGLLSRVFDKIWALELQLIKKGKKIPFGGSCLIIGQKRTD